MGPQKDKNETISVGHSCEKRAMGTKKSEMGQKNAVLWRNILLELRK